MKKHVPIVVCGAAGRMGRRIVALSSEHGCRVVSALERNGHPDLGRDVGLLAGVGGCGVQLTSDVRPAVRMGQVVIDFSSPEAALEHAIACRDERRAFVLGTTGLGPKQKAALARVAEKIPVLTSPNMSLGVNILLDLVAEASRRLRDYDAEVVEVHHSRKVDAPSGTALRLAERIAEAREIDLGRVARYERRGTVGARKRDEIGIQTVRAGDVVGDHTVIFGGPGERIELTHRAQSRDVFAVGAMRAAVWLAGKRPGLYDMGHVLGLK